MNHLKGAFFLKKQDTEQNIDQKDSEDEGKLYFVKVIRSLKCLEITTMFIGFFCVE